MGGFTPKVSVRRLKRNTDVRVMSFKYTNAKVQLRIKICILGSYISWNLHQPTTDLKFSYDGNLNLFKFIEIAQKNDLLVILRPGPFIDSERDMVWFLFHAINKCR